MPVEARRFGLVAEAGPRQEGLDERRRAFQQAHVGKLQVCGARSRRAGEQHQEQGEGQAWHGRLEASHSVH